MEPIWIKNYDAGFPTTMKYPDKTMYELFVDSVNANPSLFACSFLGTKISFQSLLDLVDKTAFALTAMGMQKGDVATICLPNTPHAVIAFYALNKIGIVANMVHPLTPSDELFHNIQDTRSTCLFVLDAFLPKYIEMLTKTKNRYTIICSIPDYLSPAMKVGFYITKGRKIKKVKKDITMLEWKDLLKESSFDSIKDTTKNPSKNNLNVIGQEASLLKDESLIETKQSYTRVINPDECAVYLHSGGTMGTPKTVMLSSANLNVLALQGPYIIGIQNPAGLSMATILPLFHGFGLCMGMHTMMVNGITAILVPQFSAESLASLLIKEKPDFIAAVPTLLEGIMNNKSVQKQDLSYLKAVFCGGDTLTGELKTRFDQFLQEHKCNAQVREGYGLTETVTVCSVNPIGNNRANTVGLPLADILMKIVETGSEEEVAIGDSGEICVTGPTVMMGYLDDLAATKEAIHMHGDGRSWVHTGDYGFMDIDGFFHFTQRIKRIIKVSGVPVFPSQIEDIIASIPGIKEVGAIGIPHPYKIQIVKAFVVLEDSSIKIEEMRKLITDVCLQKTIRYAVPAQIQFMEKLPRTKVGKIDIPALEKEH